MPITTIIIISLLIANLVLTLLMFWIIHDLLAATKSLKDMEDLYKHTLELCNKQIREHNEALRRVYDRETKTYEDTKSWMKSVNDAYQIIRKQYDTIIEMHTKLLECWKGCEERYSQSYELFKHCSDNLKEVSFQLTDLANVSTEDEYTLTLHEACDTVCLECPYEDCKNGLKYEDKMLDCPIWKIKSNQREIEAELEETDEFLRWKARDEWTDDDYRDAANTHLEDIQEGTDDDK